MFFHYGWPPNLMPQWGGATLWPVIISCQGPGGWRSTLQHPAMRRRPFVAWFFGDQGQDQVRVFIWTLADEKRQLQLIFFCCSLLTIIVWTILRYGHISTGRGFGKRWYISGLLAVDCTIFHDCCHELHARDVCWHLPPQVSKVRSIVWYWSSRRVGLKVCQRFAFWDSSSGLVWKKLPFLEMGDWEDVDFWNLGGFWWML